MTSNVYTITLLDNGDAPDQYKALKPTMGSTLRFVLPVGSFVCPLSPKLYTNFPTDKSKSFQRSVYYEVFSVQYNGSSNWTAEVRIDRPGCFDYHIAYVDAETHQEKKSTTGHYMVDPILTINGNYLPPEGLIVQTYITKCLGELSTWEAHLRTSAEVAYNMVHFTPVQEIGLSGSSYSIFDQRVISSKLFSTPEHPAVSLTEPEKRERLREVIEGLEVRCGLLSMTDVVWNHTAQNSPWLVDHPEAAYNLTNSPHLKVAYELDRALMNFSHSLVGAGSMGPHITTEAELDNIIRKMRETVFPAARLWEYFVVDVAAAVAEFRDAVLRNARFDTVYGEELLPEVKCVEIIRHDGLYKTGDGERFSTRVKLGVALALFNVPVLVEGGGASATATMTPDELTSRCKHYEHALNAVNLPIYQKYDADVEVIVRNTASRARYQRLNPTGPRLGPITHEHPLCVSLFTVVQRLDGPTQQTFIPLANNGWIWDGNPLVDFAGAQSETYWLRDLIVWGDCVKLRYGTGPQDSPWLWEHMKQYTEDMARVFHALRIDNAHSTPIHVAQYLLDAARNVRPNIYITAELFTGSENLDALFVSKLGISSLIREAMRAEDSWELSRLCHRHGGPPIASFSTAPTLIYGPSNMPAMELTYKLPDALFYECTHDNETPFQRRSADDALPNAALVSMTSCAIGSSRGYDELAPYTIDVVTEHRKYHIHHSPPTWGILPVKSYLNRLHKDLAIKGFNEIYVDHQSDHTITVQRHSPITHQAVYVIAHTAFQKHGGHHSVHAVRIPGEVTEIIFYAQLQVPQQNWFPHPSVITGLDANLTVRTDSPAQMKDIFEIRNGFDIEPFQELKLQEHRFPKGSVLAFRVQMAASAQAALRNLYSLLHDDSPLQAALEGVGLVDLNVLLYRHDTEERATTDGGAYQIAGQQLSYCGLQGFMTPLARIAKWNDLSHPLCQNLRDGNWAMDYTVNRLDQRGNLTKIQIWLRNAFALVQALPRFLIPHYFYVIVAKAYLAARERALSVMSNFVRASDNFVQDLALTSVQLFGVVKGAPLLLQSERLAGFLDPTASLAAGLPHFSAGYMRNWGRDTFISLRGMLLVTGRYEHARQLLIGYGACVRHGLVPNLLDGGVHPRYNARDAVWWYLQALQDYCCLSPEGVQFLQVSIPRLFLNDTAQDSATSTVGQLVQEIMERHAVGIHFREWNAGKEIDDRMQDQGFQVDVELDARTGFLFGGNQSNCGTWMDKMGESQKAGNYGLPATPRDGAPIEITGLLKSTVRWLAHLQANNQFSEAGVRTGAEFISYADWNQLIAANFERCYCIPEKSADDESFDITPKNVNRRGIYKDTYGGELQWTDYQFRPNCCVAMAVAPELFTRARAQHALEMVEKVLVGPLGMRTLDPTDWAYRPNYENSDDSTNKETAKGWNYHQGPEWLWCLGYFLRAKINFWDGDKATISHYVHRILRSHKQTLAESSYAALPELTNKDGAPCHDSCDAQAWSMATLLDALQILNNMQ